MRFLASFVVCLFAASLAACNSCPKTDVVKASAPDCKPVYAPPCKDGNYDPAKLPPYEEKEVRCPFRGLGIPGLECSSTVKFSAEAPAAAAPCAPAVTAAPLPEPGCGPYPTDAKPGEVYCCVWHPPVAAAMQTVQTGTRSEWVQITCPPLGSGAQECWTLKVEPVFEQKMAAPPRDGFWTWERNTQCEVPKAASTSNCVPAAGAAAPAGK